jgi:hypothetical protein
MALISVSNNALSDISTLPASIPTGSLTLIKSITASASANISFVDGTDGVVLDGTYLSYVFKFINIHPATDSTHFTFQASTDSGSNYGITITSTAIDAYHLENDTSPTLQYSTGNDLAQSTSFQNLGSIMGNGNDDNLSGTLQIFNPSSTTYVKHWISNINHTYAVAIPLTIQELFAGYFNTTSAINAIQFKMTSGNIDDGIIKMYGVK